MNSRPILFSAPMVRALLAGTKTQTRRVVTGSTSTTSIRWSDLNFSDAWVDNTGAKEHGGPCQYLLHVSKPVDGTQHRVFPRIQIRDRLWVRETWAPADWMATGGYADPPQTVAYRADQTARVFRWEEPHTAVAANTYGWNWGSTGWKWKPSIFMPRWASRLTLEVTDVRVERVNHISEVDAKAEGVTPDSDCVANRCARPHRDKFFDLWNGINGKRPGCKWQDNPWVWAISFKRVAP